MNPVEKSFSQKLSNNLEATFLSLVKHFKQFCLIIGTLFIPLFSFDNITHFESTSAALSLPTKTVLVERMPTHEMNGWEVKAVLALNTIVAQKWFRRCL